MEPQKIGFLEEAPGHKSSTRLFSLFMVIFFFLFNFIYLAQSSCELSYEFIFYNFVLLIGIFAPKYLSKLAEIKLGTFNKKR